MIICLRCNRQMIKDKTIVFKTTDMYGYEAIKVVCPECSDSVALTTSYAWYGEVEGDFVLLKEDFKG